jgi:hypothetical protein
MKAIIEYVRNKECNFCSPNEKGEPVIKPFLVQVNFLRICKDCIDKLWKLSEGIE